MVDVCEDADVADVSGGVMQGGEGGGVDGGHICCSEDGRDGEEWGGGCGGLHDDGRGAEAGARREGAGVVLQTIARAACAAGLVALGWGWAMGRSWATGLGHVFQKTGCVCSTSDLICIPLGAGLAL